MFVDNGTQIILNPDKQRDFVKYVTATAFGLMFALHSRRLAARSGMVTKLVLAIQGN